MFRHDWSLENVRKAVGDPYLLLNEIVFELYRAPVTYLSSKIPIGTNVFEREWDVLIVLDSCRVDALEAVANEYEFLGEIRAMTSVGASTPEWVVKTFDTRYSEEIRDTAYISANPWTKSVLEERYPERADWNETFLSLKLLSVFDHVSVNDCGKVEYAFNCDQEGEQKPDSHPEGLLPPRYVTERGIAVGRENDFDGTV